MNKLSPVFALSAAIALSGCVTTFDADRTQHIVNACPQIRDVKLKTLSTTPFKNNINGSINIEGAIGVVMDLTEEAAYDGAISYIRNLKKGEKIFFALNSSGGDLEVTRQFLSAIKKTKGTIITFAYKKASSAASLLLTAGTKGHRYIAKGTNVITHAARNGIIKIEGENSNSPVIKIEGAIFEKDLPEGSDSRKRLENANEELRQHYISASQTKIGRQCANHLVQGKIDVRISPETLLKLGLVDVIIDPQKPSEITVRANSPRFK